MTTPLAYAQEQTADSQRDDYPTPHGERRTYIKGCRCQPCSDVHKRYCKMAAFRRHSGYQARVPRDQAIAVLNQLNDLGFADYAVAREAGVSSATVSRLRTGQRGSVSKATFDALSRVTEVSTGLVPGELTRLRVHSLQRAGWHLRDIEEAAGVRLQGGGWRYTEHVAVRIAAAVRDAYRLLESRDGGNRQVAGQSKAKGFPLPAEWDDPGTLAWPKGGREVPDVGPDVDLVAVDRWLAGDTSVTLTADEKLEAIRRAPERGVSRTRLMNRWHMSGSRFQALVREACGQEEAPAAS